MTAQEFIAWELDRPGRHEFFRGEVIKVFGDEGARREDSADNLPIFNIADDMNFSNSTPESAGFDHFNGKIWV